MNPEELSAIEEHARNHTVLTDHVGWCCHHLPCDFESEIKKLAAELRKLREKYGNK